LALRPLLLLLLCLLGGCAADAGFEFISADAAPLRGPAAAKGAMIWSHGANGFAMKEGKDSPTPPLAALFREEGWDVFRLNRDAISEDEMRLGAGAALAERAADLKSQGYRRIILAGQSAGAWASLVAAGRSADVDAVFALAPACCGTPAGSQSPFFLMNRDVLYTRLEQLRHGRVVVFFPRGDPYDLPGRSTEAERILSQDGVHHLVIDHPAGLSGHGAGQSVAFARRYGRCMLAIAETDAMPTCGNDAAKEGPGVDVNRAFSAH
jgi:dienelactone hydrolase